MLITDRDLTPSCYDYTRVSGYDQGQNGLSLGVQNEDLKRYHGMFLPDVKYGTEKYDSSRKGLIVDRGISAWSQDLFTRPGGRVLARALKPGDHVCFTRLDRGFRSVNDFSKVLPIWQTRNISIHFVDQNLNLGSANGKLMAHMLVALAQWESDIKSERVRSALAQKKKLAEQGVKSVANEKIVWEPSPELARINQMIDRDRNREKTTDSNGRVFFYTRASHADSVDSGLGLSAQLDSATRYGEYLLGLQEHHGLQIGGHFEDGRQGRNACHV